MLSDRLQKVVDTLKKQGKMDFFEGATLEQITNFEKDNKIEFPKGYKEWLGFSDGGECFLPAGVQFYGVAHKPFIDVSDSDRPDDRYIVIGALATGDPILFEKGTEQISIYNHEDGKIEDDETYQDFCEFLDDLYELLGIGG